MITSDLPKLAAPAQRALASVGVTQLVQLSKYSKSTLSSLHGIGPNAIKTLQEALKKKGLTLRV